MKKLLLLLLFFSFHSTLILAGDELKVGDTAPDFELMSTDDKMVSLSDFHDKEGVIVIFTCNHCPYSKAYEDRIIELHSKFDPVGYPVVAINPNDVNKVPEDSFENMKKRHVEKDFNFSYLHDLSQKTASAYGASRTPHVFLLKSEGSNFKVAYIGAIDNNVKDANAADEKYVEDAISDLQKGRLVERNFTKAIGCSIKWKE
jgi:peroxiredoxin